MNLKIDYNELKKLVEELISVNQGLLFGEDEKFVFWFLKAHLSEKEEAGIKAIVGGSGDKGVDAVYIDEEAQKVYVIQGKFRQTLGMKQEPRKDLKAFFLLPAKIDNDKEFNKFLYNIKPEVKERLLLAKNLVKHHNFVFNYYYVTTANISAAIEKKIRKDIKAAEDRLYFFDAAKIKDLAENYIYAYVPSASEISLHLDRNEDSVTTHNGTLDGMNVRAWILNVAGDEISRIVREHSYRIFNRNVRGFLGKSRKVNKDIEYTATKHPEKFWYYNNGITMICSDATFDSNKNEIIVIRPQIINGQQTAKILESLHALNENELRKVSVLLRLIRVGISNADTATSNEFIKQVVKSSNWQNSISSADLMANEPEQVYIERALKPFDFYYMRRKMTKSEANLRGARRLATINRDDMGKALAVTKFDPSFAKSKELLYRDEYYGKIFVKESADFYLTRYLMMILVREAARSRGGDYTRANWAALAYLWKDLDEFLRAETAKRFIAASKRWAKKMKDGNALGYLFGATLIVVNDLVAFFRSEEKRASDADKKTPNIADFLRQPNIADRFDKFFAEENKTDLQKYRLNLGKFKLAIKKESMY
jgi:hypothetical protein